MKQKLVQITNFVVSYLIHIQIVDLCTLFHKRPIEKVAVERHVNVRFLQTHFAEKPIQQRFLHTHNQCCTHQSLHSFLMVYFVFFVENRKVSFVFRLRRVFEIFNVFAHNITIHNQKANAINHYTPQTVSAHNIVAGAIL